MLTTYRRVLGLPGALLFSLSGLVARLPISMVSLGIVVLVSTRTGSYGLAGGVSASFLVATAVLAVPQARLLDRLGQSRVLPLCVAVFAAGLVATMATVEQGLGAPWPHLCAAVAGAGQPQIGSSIRARWSALVPDKRALQTAFAVEAVVDESVFIAGPTLVTVLATEVHPLAGLTAAVVAAVVGTTVLVVQRSTEPPPGGRTGHGTSRMPWGVLLPITVCTVGQGMLFGGAEVSTVAFADEARHTGVAGVLLAVWALGSLLAGVVVGALTLSAPSSTRFRWGLLVLALLMSPLPLVHGLWALAGLLFLAGSAISPTLIAGVGWVEEVVPADRITEGITFVNTGLAAGVAPGAAVAGIVIDRFGASPSYLVSAGAGLLAALLAFVVAAGTGSLRMPRPSPSGSSR